MQASIPIDSGPAAAAIGYGAVWVAAHRSSKVFRIDPAKNTVMATIAVPDYKGNPGGAEGPIAVGPHGVWIPIRYRDIGANPGDVTPFRLLRIDPATNAVTINKPFDGFYNVVDTADGVWIGVDPTYSMGPVRKTLIRIDPATGSVLRTIDLGPLAAGPAYVPWFDVGFGSLWAVVSSTQIVRVDPSSGNVLATITTPGIPQGLVAAGGDSHVFVEVVNAANAAVVARVDPSANCVDATALIGAVGSLAGNPLTESPAGLYVAFGKGSLALVDTATMRPLRSIGLDTADYLGQSSYGFGSVWFPTWGDNSLLRVKPLEAA